MKEGGTPLYATPALGDVVTDYARAHSSALPKHIVDYHADASGKRDDSEMLSSNFQSQLQLLLANSIGAKQSMRLLPLPLPPPLLCCARCVILGGPRMLRRVCVCDTRRGGYAFIRGQPFCHWTSMPFR